MKLSCPCCNNEITPAETDHTYVIGIGEETCQETTQEHLQSSKSTRMASDKALGPYGVSLGIPDSKQLPDIRVETPEGSRLDLFRWQNTGMQTSRLMTENGRLPTALQLCILRWIMPLQNKANTKLFGSVKAVRNEQTRHMEAGWIIHPCSALRLYWNFLMLVLLIINMYALPLIITFLHEDMPFYWAAFNILCDIFFLTDIVLNFRTGIMVNDVYCSVVLEPKKIAVRYLHSWFIIDLISSLPLDYMITAFTHYEPSQFVGASRALKVLRLSKLLSFLRLLRVTRLVRYLSQYEVIFNWTKMFIRFVNLIGVMTLVAHWNACLQYLVPSLSGYPSGSWVSLHRLSDVSWPTKYVWSLFKALSHMLCIGYGRFPPQTVQEVIVTIFSMLSGATCYGIFIAYCIAAIQQNESSRRQYHEKVQQIMEYMSYRKLPAFTREKVLNYFEHRYSGKFFDEKSILGEISWPLRNEIISHNCRDVVNTLPFFDEADPNFVSRIITKLTFEVFLEGDVIIQEGTMGTEMYFLQEGTVEVRVKNICQNELRDGSYFGEICLLTNAPRVASVVATSTCDTFVLSASDFQEVLGDFPDMRSKIEEVAEQRLQFIKGKQAGLSSFGLLDLGDGKNSDITPADRFAQTDQHPDV